MWRIQLTRPLEKPLKFPLKSVSMKNSFWAHGWNNEKLTFDGTKRLPREKENAELVKSSSGKAKNGFRKFIAFSAFLARTKREDSRLLTACNLFRDLSLTIFHSHRSVTVRDFNNLWFVVRSERKNLSFSFRLRFGRVVLPLFSPRFLQQPREFSTYGFLNLLQKYCECRATAAAHRWGGFWGERANYFLHSCQPRNLALLFSRIFRWMLLRMLAE